MKKVFAARNLSDASTVYQVFDEVILMVNRVAWFVPYVLFEIDGDEKEEYINRLKNRLSINRIEQTIYWSDFPAGVRAALPDTRKS